MNSNRRKEILHELNRLMEIMVILRGPEGCPWDQKQDYHSIKGNIIEEAYEVVEALEKNDISAFKEELGDLLLQVVFQSQIGAEKNDFDLGDVITVLIEKLIRRHPHVFAETKVSDSEDVLRNWEKIKAVEKEKNDTNKSLLDKVNQGQPALNQAYDLQDIAAERGFDWKTIVPVLNKIEEELSECKELIGANPDNTIFAAVDCDDQVLQEKLELEIGDLLFAVVNFARFKNINPEIALLKTILKFKKRFSFIEETIAEKNANFQDYNLEELNKIWDQAKEKE